MKTNKYRCREYTWFYYALQNKSNFQHGLVNNSNSLIGYVYQDELKGFWLTHKKI
jgi:hypothetical protein